MSEIKTTKGEITNNCGKKSNLDHDESWLYTKFSKCNGELKKYVFEIELDLSNAKFSSKYNIGERIVFPATGLFFYVWYLLAKVNNRTMEETAIIFEDVVFKDVASLFAEKSIKFKITLCTIEGTFDVKRDLKNVVSGKVYTLLDSAYKKHPLSRKSSDEESLLFTGDDIYKELGLRGYHYNDVFRGIISADTLLRYGSVAWNDNWIAFLDTIFQFHNMGCTSRDLHLLHKLQRLTIHPVTHLFSIVNGATLVHNQREIGVITTGGVEIRGVEWIRRKPIITTFPFLLDDCLEQRKIEHAYMSVSQDLSFQWFESPVKYSSFSADTELCYVKFAALNNCDLMTVAGKLLPDKSGDRICNKGFSLGIEFSGVTSNGKRVMGIVSTRALATTVVADKHFLWEVPDNWPLNMAATIPVAYTTVYFALVMKGKMKQGDTVLIHLGASDVGLAAIALALQEGCKVYTTVESLDKYQYLLCRFLELRKSSIHIGCDASFEDMVMQRTEGSGVDIVVNLLEAPDMFMPTVRCLAEGGRFLQLAALDNVDSNVKVGPLFSNKTFHTIVMDSISDADKIMLANYIKDGITYGQVSPLHNVVYDIQELQEAMQYMTKKTYIGKVLIRIQAENQPAEGFKTTGIVAIPRTYMYPHKTYIFVGYPNDCILELAEWLIRRGATKLVLNSHLGVSTGYQSWFITRWRQQGVTVKVLTEYVGTEEAAIALLKEGAALGPVGGIFISPQQITSADANSQPEDNYVTAVTKVLDLT